ncbi:MAG TPA: DNA polymerase III subunit beta [Fibrobacteres bacterium]|nr:DNA polymerase III subunit beta [Fibrobacterota bacterium]
MKFEVQKPVFLDALHMACNAIPSKTTLQILYNLLFQLKGNELEIRATDLDMTIVLKLQVEGHKNGSIVVNARKLLEVVKELPDFPVIISVDDFLFTIKSESGFHGTLTGYDASEYPSLPEVEHGKAFKAPLKDLRFLAEKASFAVSTDFSRMSLTGVYCEGKNGKLEMVATDGHRFGKAWIELKGATLPGVILPPKALGQVLRMSEDPEELIEIEIGAAQARFSTQAITLLTKLIDGPYPNYENVIPKEFARNMKCNREHLMSVLRRVSTLSNAKTHLVVFGFEAKSLQLTAKNPDLGGDSEESLPVEFQGEKVEVGVNAAYMLEELRLSQSEEIRLKFNNPLGAVVVEPVMDKPNYFFIVMPLRILKEPG